MKGMVFTEFIEFVEQEFGFEMSDAIITQSDLKSGGVYTAVGTYDFQEMVNLLISLNKQTKIPLNDLLLTYGKHLFFRFVDMYPQFIHHTKSLFDFISGIDHYIHVEVLKLYPDAELPRMAIQERTDKRIVIIYKSERKLTYFALGLFQSSADYFKEDVDITFSNIKADGSEVKFIITK